MSILVFSDRHQLLLHLPSPRSPAGHLTDSPLKSFSPLLLALQLVEEDGDWFEELEGSTFRLLCSSYCHHTLVAVGEASDSSDRLQHLLSFFLSCCRRLCGPGLLGLPHKQFALSCLLHQWRTRGSLLAGVGSLDVHPLAVDAKQLLEGRLSSWLEVRQRLKLPLHMLLLDNRARILFASSSFSSHSLLFLQLYMAARLDDNEIAEDGSLTDSHFGLPEEAVEVLHLKLHDFPYSPCVVTACRTGNCVALAVVELGDEQQRHLVAVARRCLAWGPGPGSESLLKEIQLNVKAFQKSCKLRKVNQEVSRLSRDLESQPQRSQLTRMKLRQLLDSSLQAFSTVTNLALSSFKSSRSFPLCFLRLDPPPDLRAPPGVSDLRGQNPSLLVLFVLNTTTGKSFTKKFDRSIRTREGQKNLQKVASELLEVRKQLRKVVSHTKEVAGITVYLLRLLVDKEGRVHGEEVANREGLQRLETICLFQPGPPIDLGRVTLALARLCSQIQPTLI